MSDVTLVCLCQLVILEWKHMVAVKEITVEDLIDRFRHLEEKFRRLLQISA